MPLDASASATIIINYYYLPHRFTEEPVWWCNYCVCSSYMSILAVLRSVAKKTHLSKSKVCKATYVWYILSSKPFKVKTANGKEWWYVAGALTTAANIHCHQPFLIYFLNCSTASCSLNETIYGTGFGCFHSDCLVVFIYFHTNSNRINH